MKPERLAKQRQLDIPGANVAQAVNGTIPMLTEHTAPDNQPPKVLADDMLHQLNRVGGRGTRRRETHVRDWVQRGK